MTSNIKKTIEQAARIVVGKEDQIRMALICFLARGHLLIEDLPGVGKTTLSHLLARLMGLDFNRIQFTSDLLPADIIGASVYDRNSASFSFHPGPIFTQVVLADEVNRTTPKTQSALLEAMEEHQVTVEGETYPLPQPFFVIATQNPVYHIGTFPLPESQLDRFLMRIELGFPDPQAERILLKGKDRRSIIEKLDPCVDSQEILNLQQRVRKIYSSDALLDYLQALLAYTREQANIPYGLTPRAGLALLRAAQACALLDDRNEVLPEDIQTVFPAVASHRLRQQDSDQLVGELDLCQQIIQAVAIP